MKRTGKDKKKKGGRISAQKFSLSLSLSLSLFPSAKKTNNNEVFQTRRVTSLSDLSLSVSFFLSFSLSLVKNPTSVLSHHHHNRS
jgi:hypothetical protein